MDYLHQSATSRSVTIVLAYQCSTSQSGQAPFHAHHESKNIKAGAWLTFSTSLFRTILISAALLCSSLNSSIMTFEEVSMQKPSERAQGTGKALEELLVSAKSNECLTIGVYESAKVMNV